MIKNKLLQTFVMIMAAALMGTVCGAETGAPARDEIKEEFKWNLQDIYKTKDEWNKDIKKIKEELINKVKKFKGKLSKEDDVLKCMEASEELSRKIGKIYVFAALSSDENQSLSEATEMLSKAESLHSEAAEAAAFIEPELLSLSEKSFSKLKKAKKLKKYLHYFSKLEKKKKHTLSKAEEELLARVQEIAGAPKEAYDKLSLADIKLPSIKNEEGVETALTNSNYNIFIRSKNREVRKNAFDGMYKTYEAYQNTFAATLNSEVKKNIFFARSRKYDSAMEASISQDFVSKSVYDNLIKTVNENIVTLHRYISLRKKMLGVDKVRLYDMYTGLLNDVPELKISYEEAKSKIKDGLKILGKDYSDNLEKAFKERWIDVYETKNKYNGAYNWGTYDTHPFILMNYNDTLDAMLTTAHELGHAMHSYYTNKNQGYINSETPIFTAEVASTANEMILIDYMIKNAKDDNEKYYLIDNLIENIRGTVFTQVMYAEFEKNIHERVESGEALSAETIRKIWGGLMAKYYGSDFETDELATMWWSRVPHFYMSFYVYKYATGISAAYKLSNDIINNEKNAQKRYLEFLKAGDSGYPLEILKSAGVDMTKKESVENLLKLFDKLVTEMEQWTDKRASEKTAEQSLKK